MTSLEELKKITMEEEHLQTSEQSKAKLVSSTATPDEASTLVVIATPSPSTCTKIGSPSVAQQSYKICSKEKAKLLIMTFSFGAGPVKLGNLVCPQIASSQCMLLRITML